MEVELINKQDVMNIISDIQSNMAEYQKELTERDEVLLGNFIKGQLTACQKLFKRVNTVQSWKEEK